MVKVDFVANQQDRDFIISLHSNYLFFHCLNILKGLVIGQTVANDKTLTVLDVEVPHRRELLRAGRVQDFQDAGRAVHLDLLAIEVLDGGVVLFHEVAGDELDGEGRLADTAGAENDHFEFSHFLNSLSLENVETK